MTKCLPNRKTEKTQPRKQKQKRSLLSALNIKHIYHIRLLFSSRGFDSARLPVFLGDVRPITYLGDGDVLVLGVGVRHVFVLRVGLGDGVGHIVGHRLRLSHVLVVDLANNRWRKLRNDLLG